MYVCLYVYGAFTWKRNEVGMYDILSSSSGTCRSVQVGMLIVLSVTDKLAWHAFRSGDAREFYPNSGT